MESAERMTELLQEVNDNQKRLLEQHEEALQLQRQHLRLLQVYLEKTPEDDKRELESTRIQRRGKRMVDRSQQMFLLIIFLLVVLLFFVSWSLFSR